MTEPGGGDWLAARVDPVRERWLATPASERFTAIREWFPPLRGEPAFDPAAWARAADALVTQPAVNTGDPLLDRSVRVGLASIDFTFEGDHPKYGVGTYAEDCHDGFPPTIIAAVDALTAWGLGQRAAALFDYWLNHFVTDDGALRYRGTSLAELGQLLQTAHRLAGRHGPDGWWDRGAGHLARIAAGLLARLAETTDDGLLGGVPEDDEKDKPGRYFHNNAQVAAGLERWSDLADGAGRAPGADTCRRGAARLHEATLAAIDRCWPTDPDDWWLPPKIEPLPRPTSLTSSRDASYTNYRYWPELLASGVLRREQAERLVTARLTAGGQFCGMTRFRDWLDDWPLADYLTGLWRLGRHDDYRLSLAGHIAYHQAADHLTAYEQVTFPPGQERASACLPCQLVAARSARRLNR